MESYIHFLPEELLGLIVPLDSEASGLFNLIRAYPELESDIINGFLLLYPKIYKVIRKISEYLKVNTSIIFKYLFEYIVEKYDSSTDYDFIEKYNGFSNGSSLINEIMDIFPLGKKYNLLIFIILYFYFIIDYPSVVQYYINNKTYFGEPNIYDLFKLYTSINTHDLINPDSFDENIIIDILKLLMKDDKNFSVEEMIISRHRILELEASGKYDQLIKFLIDNGIQIIE